MMRKILAAVLLLVIGAAIGGGLMLGGKTWDGWFGRGPDPVTIANASLDAVREQNRLVPFAARFVAVVSSEQKRFGLSARKTLILPGLVRYEIDLAKLAERDLSWDAETQTLTILLPPVELSGPQIDLKAMSEFQDGRLLMALSDAESRLDAANRKAAEDALLRQARGAVPMRLARDAAARAIERSFVMPLRAAGLDAKVVARFADQDRS
jgi:hypothetical protein